MSRAAKLRLLPAIVCLTTACWQWVRWTGPADAQPVCRLQFVETHLDSKSQPPLGWFSREVGFATTPLKRRGVSGWRETYCTGIAEGTLVRDAQKSTDGFWTMDVRLQSLSVDGAPVVPIVDSIQRYIRVEVEPGTAAHTTCQQRKPRGGDAISVGGVIVVDTDRDFLEIHPIAGFNIKPAH